MLTTKDIARICGVSRLVVVAWIKRDRLPAKSVLPKGKKQRVWLVYESDLNHWLSTIGVLLRARKVNP